MLFHCCPRACARAVHGPKTCHSDTFSWRPAAHTGPVINTQYKHPASLIQLPSTTGAQETHAGHPQTPVQPSFRNGGYPYGEAPPNRRTVTSDISAGSADLGVSPTNAESSTVPITSQKGVMDSETPPGKYTKEKNRTRSIQDDCTPTAEPLNGTTSFSMSTGVTPRASPSVQRTTYPGMMVDTSSAARGENTVQETAAITDVRPKPTAPPGYTASIYRGTLMLKVIMKSSPSANFAVTMRSLLQQTCLLLAKDIPIQDVTVSFAKNKMFLPCVTVMSAAS